jgi:hypothetical protein
VLCGGPKAKQAWTYPNSDIRFLDNFTFGVGRQTVKIADARK